MLLRFYYADELQNITTVIWSEADQEVSGLAFKWRGLNLLHIALDIQIEANERQLLFALYIKWRVEWYPLPLHPFPESPLSKSLERTQQLVPVYMTTNNVHMDVRQCAFPWSTYLPDCRQRFFPFWKTPALYSVHRYALFRVTHLRAKPSWLEPLESELAVQVEYDMDEQGERHWLGVMRT